MDISEDLAPEDMVVHRMTPSSILSPESGPVRGGGGAIGGGGAAGGGGGAAIASELGRRLLLAARLGDTPLVLDLMAKGAPFTTDWLGTSALHAAARGAHADTCAVLLRAGVSRDCRTKVERTPLHLAAHAGHANVAALLLRHRAAPDCRDMLRMTPLHWAAARGHARVAALLLAHGADPHALSKFNKTPHSLAREKDHRDILKLIEDALKEREAAESIESLKAATETEATESQQNTLDPSDRLQEAARQTIKQSPQPEPGKITLERPPLETSSEQTAASAAAAAMLRRHGIALLPRDAGCTVLSALQSGRSVVLSDAGKLMLKESSEIPPVVKSTPASAPAPAPAPAPASKGVVLTATPVKSPPRQGVKIFTLNNKMLAMPKENKAPVKKVINPHDSMQIQYIKLPSDAKAQATRSTSMKAKHRLPPSPSPSLAPSPRVLSALARPTVKLMMQKANLNKLLAASDNGMEPVPRPSSDPSVLLVPEQFLTSSSPQYLRAQLLAAHRTIAALNRELTDCKTRLADYEKA